VKQVPTISVIVVTHNGRRWLEDCLRSVLAQDGCAFEVVLVDNCSSDESVALVQHRFPEVRILPLSENQGFAGGNNAGARVARGDLLVFLNNDTVVEPGWLRALTDALERDPGAGLTTSRIVFLHEPDTVDSAGDGYLRAGGGFKRHHGASAGAVQTSDCPFSACGAGFAIRRALFDELGGFDEDLFLVYEDIDLSYRARLRGWHVRYVPSAIVRHAGSSTIGHFSALAILYGQRNLEWVWLKNTPAALLLRSLASHALYSVAGIIYYGARGHLLTALAAKWRALVALPRILRARRRVQATVSVSHADLWAVMSPNWIAVKRVEKQFRRHPAPEA
jgi:GT2 family glycosyltransferase